MEYGGKSISEVADETLKFINDRKEGKEVSLKTKWDKLNRELLGGLSWHDIILIGGVSGSGKTLLMNEIESSLIDRNPNEDFICVNFNFEMLARDLIVRKLSSIKSLTIQELLSASENYKLTDKDMAEIKIELEKLKFKNVYYFDKPRNISLLSKTIDYCWEKFKKPMVIFLDHTILVNKSASESSTTDMMYNLGAMLTEYKKKYKCIFIIATQLNRDIEATERKQRPSSLNYPIKSDISYSEKVAA